MALKKYAIFYKVEIAEASDAIGSIGYNGPLSSVPNELAIAKIPSCMERYILIGEQEAVKNFVTPGIACLQEWHYLNLMEAIPTLYPETTEKFLPHELNLHQMNAIDFEKGCFTGQEIIARMHYRGKSKKQLYKAIIAPHVAPFPGADVYSTSHQVFGTVVDVCQKQNQYYALILTNEVYHQQPLFLNPNQSESNQEISILNLNES